MVALPGRKLERRGDVPRLEKWVIGYYLIAAGARSQEIKHILDADTQSANTGPTAAFASLDGDSGKKWGMVFIVRIFPPAANLGMPSPALQHLSHIT